jgi:hypothetical protein
LPFRRTGLLLDLVFAFRFFVVDAIYRKTPWYNSFRLAAAIELRLSS